MNVGKKLKIGLPFYSSMEVSAYLTVELEKNEKPNWKNIWDVVNQQLMIQRDEIDPSWISIPPKLQPHWTITQQGKWERKGENNL